MVNVTTEVRTGDAGQVETIPTSEQLFGARAKDLVVTGLPDPFVPCNPSIVHCESPPRMPWSWTVSVRAVDYRLGVPNVRSSSKNYLIGLDRDLRAVGQVELVDESGLPKNPRARTTGYEDLRLFYCDGRLRALATACDIINGGGMPEMCRLAIGNIGAHTTYVIAAAHALRGPWSRHPQKNWTPIADGVGDRVIYRLYPTLVMYPEGNWTSWSHGGYAEDLDEHDFVPASVRGSSQAIPFAGGWLTIVHEHKTKRPLSYVHRFLWLDSDLVVRKVSRDFVWLAAGVEFCAGLATDGEKMIATFGVHDSRAYMTVFDPADVMPILKTISGG